VNAGTWSAIFAGVSAAVAVVSAILSGIAALRSRDAKKVAEQKRDEAVAAAQAMASGVGRIATVQESRLTAAESAQASGVVFVQSPIQGGRTGWRVQNDSEQPVTNVVVRSTTGAKIQVYNNDLTQLDEYVEHTLGAHQQSQLMFRPTDSEAVRADPAEVERMSLRFTDARHQTWERIGSQRPQPVNP
jgi:hypothetical protein